MQHIRIPLFIFLILFASCRNTTVNDDRPVVTVSILPQKYLVEKIAGDNLRVNVLVPPGANPETYEPTPGQMREVSNSIIYFRLGYVDFERTILRNIARSNREIVVVDTGEGMEMIASEIVDHGDHVHLYGVDPHIWLSLPGAVIQADNMTRAITEADPKNREFYLDNYTRLVEELVTLHESLLVKFSNAKRNTFLIFHPALGYFARDYGLTQVAIEQEGKSPTAANMRHIIDLARKEGLNDVLIQMEFERDNANSVARELGGKVIEVNPLSENWLESMRDIADKLLTILNK